MAKAKEILDEVIETIKVELKELKEGMHTIFTAKGPVEFKDGAAEVASDVAVELKEADLVK